MKRKNKSLRAELSTYTAKICSYLECGKIIEARQWAWVMQTKLKEMGLLVDMQHRTAHNRPQSENETTVNNLLNSK